MEKLNTKTDFEKTLNYILSDPEFVKAQKSDLVKFGKVMDKVEHFFRDLHFLYRDILGKIESENYNNRQIKKELEAMREAFESHHIAIELKNSLPDRIFEEFENMIQDLEERNNSCKVKNTILDKIKDIF